MQGSYLARDTETFKEVSRANVHERLMKPRNLNSQEDLKPVRRPELGATNSHLLRNQDDH